MPATAEQTGAAFRDCVQHRMRSNERLYGVIDAARAYPLATAARDPKHGATPLGTLFTGPLGKYLDHVAPHLVAIDPAGDFLCEWAKQMGKSIGILLLTDADAASMAAHLRSIFVVTDEGEAEFSFRFYDPRVLRLFLTSCTAEQATELFGPIRMILLESDQPNALLAAQPSRTGVKLDSAPLSQ